jgi:hypothetical protein
MAGLEKIMAKFNWHSLSVVSTGEPLAKCLFDDHVKLTLEETMKAQRGSGYIALLFL